MPLAALLERVSLTFRRQSVPAHSGVVTFDLGPATGYPLKLHLSTWQSDEPFRWESEADSVTIASGAFLEPPGIAWELLLATEGEALLQGMPVSVRKVIASAPFLGVELAQVCGQLQAARDLASTSPLLLILLVDRASATGMPQADFAEWLTQKQAVLCAAVDLPASKATAKLLSRCTLRPMIRRELLELKRCLNTPQGTALLRHHAPLCLEHFIFLSHYEGTYWPGLLPVVDGILENQRSQPGQSVWLHRQLADIEGMLGDDRQALRRVMSLEAFQRLHDRLLDHFNDQINQVGRAKLASELRVQYGGYPPAPIPGHEDILPITSWEALLQEGQRMGHCVGSYHKSVAAGRVAIYHLRAPEAVTIAISPQADGWVLREAKARFNEMPTGDAMRRIGQWMDQLTDT
ncbi:MAG: PcfJ domain-containing protein [Halomonas sp.]|uniref:PcfJ domain-containing protein n=1 Tax=Halomonas sp. TaxID=1486246 RepID=UPI002ACD4EDA|nr:PcfJ domain-containing protein [Halomonas sp.]MDZ7854204.1 PcfJ domain-containing protein [Halomonas sp.]